MMEVKIINYRGIEAAEFYVAPIALICGQNRAGKTSISQAVAAALSRNAVPVIGVPKSNIGMLLREGQKRGTCSVTGDNGSKIQVSWPGGTVNDSGELPPYASAMACGMISLATMDAKAAASLMIKILRADPTDEQITAALLAAGVNEETAGYVISHINANDIDETLKRAKEKSPVLKGQWEQITGSPYGSAKAENYKHDGYIEGAERDALRQDIDDLSAKLESCIASQAVSADEIERLKAAADKKQEAIDQGAAIADDIAGLDGQVARMETELSALPLPETTETLATCPHCAGSVVVASRSVLQKPQATLTPEQNAARQIKIDALTEVIRATKVVKQQKERDRIEASRTLNLAIAAENGLSECNTDGTDPDESDKVAEQLVQAKKAEHAYQVTKDAAQKNYQITQNILIADVLAPTGIRKVALEEKRAELNQRIIRLCEAGGMDPFELNDEFQVRFFSGRIWPLIAVSEQFLCRALLQVVMAEIDGSGAVIIDAADVLDRKYRNGLFGMLAHSGMKAIVTMTMNAKSDVPDIEKAGIGRAYWLAESVLYECGAGGK